MEDSTSIPLDMNKIYAVIDYEDPYAQPLIIEALQARISKLPNELVFIHRSILEASENGSVHHRLLQWRQYESIDFDHLLAHPTGSEASLANSYIIRKALIRKHYLSNTVAHWIAKHPKSVLREHVKSSVDFELDYAEFLDDALDQADSWELRESWRRNGEVSTEADREWWILKPGMSDRGQGIRLFSSEEELKAIFEEWEPEENEGSDEDAPNEASHDADEENNNSNGVMTSHLRHFIVQPYIHPPSLLQPPHPSADRKFHIRTYVLAVGALKVYVYKRMLALFAAENYTPPSSTTKDTNPNGALSAHLTNTCLQSGEREGSVEEFWPLPTTSFQSTDWRQDVFTQICTITGEVFEAAARSMSVHFQPLPNGFEIFGVDFLVDAEGKAWLLEVNACPDFAQTGTGLQGLVRELFEGVVEVAVKPFFGLENEDADGQDGVAENMVEVLDIDLGRR
jgi:tubulin---tyrosine ligase